MNDPAMPSVMGFCSIITSDRLPWVRTLMQSIREHHPGAECFVLVIDADDSGSKEDFEVVRLDEIGLPEYRDFAFKYTPFELCCALKPHLLRYLLVDRELPGACYLDSDILVLAPFDEVVRLLGEHSLLLTPHLDTDLPDDGKKPDDAHMMLSGVFNAGFVGVRNCSEGLRFLDWWMGKLEDGCIQDHFNGRFVDQKYLDLAVGLFRNLGILTHPGCNTAYWNLHSRQISRHEGKWLSNSEPLVFYHFSDYRPEFPEVISGHQNRFDLAGMPALRELFELFHDRLKANQDGADVEYRYRYGYYDNGKAIKTGARRAWLRYPGYRARFDPFDSSAHSGSFRLRSIWQGYLVRQNRLALRLLRHL